MKRSVHEHVRVGDILPKHGGATYEALALEAYDRRPPVFDAVGRENLRRSQRRLSMAPSGIMRMRGKR